jgi:hypothetical protein
MISLSGEVARDFRDSNQSPLLAGVRQQRGAGVAWISEAASERVYIDRNEKDRR